MIQRRSGVYIQQSNAAGGLCKKGIFAVFDVYEWSFQALRRCIAGVTVSSHAKEKGVYCLYMSTYAKDSGVIHFYGKNGFVPVATLPDVHGPKEEGLVIMRKRLA